MTLLTKLSVFGAKVETTPGSPESLTGSHAAFNVYDFEIEPDIEMAERPAVIGFGTQASVPAKFAATARFKMDLGYTGLAVPTPLTILWPACGVWNDSGVFKPKTQTPDTSGGVVKTLTIGKWNNGLYEYIFGAAGNCRIVMVAGMPIVLEFEFRGCYGSRTDAAMVSPTYPTDTKLTNKGCTVTYDSVNLCPESATFDFGNTIVGKPCARGDQGYDFFLITNRSPRITINPESVLVATQDRMGKLLVGSEAAFAYDIPAASDGAFQIDAPKAQIIEDGTGDREGVRTDEIVMQLNQNFGTIDSDYTLTFHID